MARACRTSNSSCLGFPLSQMAALCAVRIVQKPGQAVVTCPVCPMAIQSFSALHEGHVSMLTRKADEVKRIRASALIDSNTTRCIKPTTPPQRAVNLCS